MDNFVQPDTIIIVYVEDFSKKLYCVPVLVKNIIESNELSLKIKGITNLGLNVSCTLEKKYFKIRLPNGWILATDTKETDIIRINQNNNDLARKINIKDRDDLKKQQRPEIFQKINYGIIISQDEQMVNSGVESEYKDITELYNNINTSILKIALLDVSMLLNKKQFTTKYINLCVDKLQNGMTIYMVDDDEIVTKTITEVKDYKISENTFLLSREVIIDKKIFVLHEEDYLSTDPNGWCLITENNAILTKITQILELDVRHYYEGEIMKQLMHYNNQVQKLKELKEKLDLKIYDIEVYKKLLAFTLKRNLSIDEEDYEDDYSMDSHNLRNLILAFIKIAGARMDTIHDFYEFNNKININKILDSNDNLSSGNIRDILKSILNLANIKNNRSKYLNALSFLLKDNDDSRLKFNKEYFGIENSENVFYNIRNSDSYEKRCTRFLKYIFEKYYSKGSLKYNQFYLEYGYIVKFFNSEKIVFIIDTIESFSLSQTKANTLEIPRVAYDKDSETRFLIAEPFNINLNIINLWDSATYKVATDEIDNRPFNINIDPIEIPYCTYSSTIDLSMNSDNKNLLDIIINVNDSKKISTTSGKGFSSIEHMKKAILGEDTKHKLEFTTDYEKSVAFDIKRSGDGFQRILAKNMIEYDPDVKYVLMTNDICNFFQAQVMQIPTIYTSPCLYNYYYEPYYGDNYDEYLDTTPPDIKELPWFVSSEINKSFKEIWDIMISKDIPCETCGKRDNIDESDGVSGAIMICDNCDKAYHLNCTYKKLDILKKNGYDNTIVDNKRAKFYCYFCKVKAHDSLKEIDDCCKVCCCDRTSGTEKTCSVGYCKRMYHVICLPPVQPKRHILAGDDFICPVCCYKKNNKTFLKEYLDIISHKFQDTEKNMLDTDADIISKMVDLLDKQENSPGLPPPLPLSDESLDTSVSSKRSASTNYQHILKIHDHKKQRFSSISKKRKSVSVVESTTEEDQTTAATTTNGVTNQGSVRGSIVENMREVEYAAPVEETIPALKDAMKEVIVERIDQKRYSTVIKLLNILNAHKNDRLENTITTFKKYTEEHLDLLDLHEKNIKIKIKRFKIESCLTENLIMFCLLYKECINEHLEFTIKKIYPINFEEYYIIFRSIYDKYNNKSFKTKEIKVVLDELKANLSEIKKTMLIKKEIKTRAKGALTYSGGLITEDTNLLSEIEKKTNNIKLCNERISQETIDKVDAIEDPIIKNKALFYLSKHTELNFSETSINSFILDKISDMKVMKDIYTEDHIYNTIFNINIENIPLVPLKCKNMLSKIKNNKAAKIASIELMYWESMYYLCWCKEFKKANNILGKNILDNINIKELTYLQKIEIASCFIKLNSCVMSSYGTVMFDTKHLYDLEHNIYMLLDDKDICYPNNIKEDASYLFDNSVASQFLTNILYDNTSTIRDSYDHMFDIVRYHILEDEFYKINELNDRYKNVYNPWDYYVNITDRNYIENISQPESHKNTSVKDFIDWLVYSSDDAMYMLYAMIYRKLFNESKNIPSIVISSAEMQRLVNKGFSHENAVLLATMPTIPNKITNPKKLSSIQAPVTYGTTPATTPELGREAAPPARLEVAGPNLGPHGGAGPEPGRPRHESRRVGLDCVPQQRFPSGGAPGGRTLLDYHKKYYKAYSKKYYE